MTYYVVSEEWLKENLKDENQIGDLWGHETSSWWDKDWLLDYVKEIAGERITDDTAVEICDSVMCDIKNIDYSDINGQIGDMIEEELKYYEEDEDDYEDEYEEEKEGKNEKN